MDIVFFCFRIFTWFYFIVSTSLLKFFKVSKKVEGIPLYPLPHSPSVNILNNCGTFVKTKK